MDRYLTSSELRSGANEKARSVFALIIYLEMLRRNKLAVLFTAAINNAAQAQSPGHESNGKNFFASFAYSSRLIAPISRYPNAPAKGEFLSRLDISYGIKGTDWPTIAN
jgi:hypothetical protein